MKHFDARLIRFFAPRRMNFTRARAGALVLWLAIAAGPFLCRQQRAAGPVDWQPRGRNGEISKTVILRSAAGGDGISVSPVTVALPDGYLYCRHQFDYRGWIGRGEATVVSAGPDRMVFGISVRGGDGPLDQGRGEIAVTVTGISSVRSEGACTVLPVIGDDVSVDIRAWVFDENGGGNVQWASAYPEPGFGDDPERPERIIGAWHGGYHWEGDSLCLEIHDLKAPVASEHLLSIGYTVTLKGARFSDADTSKTLKLYTYRGVPGQSEITRCFPVRR